MRDNCWIPDLIYFDDYDGDWTAYQEALYLIYKQDFLDSQPIYEGKRVQVRKYPIEFGKEESFFHITCQDYQKNHDRVPDFRRCERIRWVRKFIENYNCDPTQCEDCEGIKVWIECHKGKDRVHLLLEEERYIVVLEKREKYCLLVTAFYIEHDHTLDKKLKKYEAYAQGISEA